MKWNFKNSLIALVGRVILCHVELIYKRIQFPLCVCVCVCVCVFLHSQNRGKAKSEIGSKNVGLLW